MRYVLLGGTGTLGHEITRQLLKEKETFPIVIFSRDDHKHKEMASHFKGHPRLSFVIGDICDRNSLRRVLRAGDHVFHLAALKHVDSGEDNPEEYVAVNLGGTLAVADMAIQCGANCVVFSSTDKAVDPVNVYGACKFLSERILLHRNEAQKFTRFSVFRWGNVLGSRGSVIQELKKSILSKNIASITHPEMSRFWIPVEDAASFMLSSYRHAPSDRVLIPPIKAATVMDVARAVGAAMGRSDFVFKITGVRRGEKIHEDMISFHDPNRLASNTCEPHSQDELDALIFRVIDEDIQ